MPKENTLDLTGFTLVTSIEPCLMCLSACFWARIKRILYVLSKSKLNKNNYEGKFEILDIIRKFNFELELFHNINYENDILELVNKWEEKYREKWKYS